MALVVTDDKHYMTIADSIRANTGAESAYTPDQMAEGVNEVYKAGKIQGDYEGYTRGLNEGETNGYNLGYVDGYDKAEEEISGINPNWTDWRYFCAYNTRYSLASKLKPSDTRNGIDFRYMFYQCDSPTSREVIHSIGELDTSNGTNFAYMFQNCSWIAKIPNINTSNATSVTGIFSGCQNLTQMGGLDFSKCGSNTASAFYNCQVLKTISSIKVSESNSFPNCFINCNALTNILFEGTIGATISFNKSPLSKESIYSVVNALSDTASGTKLTLKSSAVTNAFGSTDSDEWKNLIATKPNWTITLA